ncbi:Aste57867_10259 [Aphanomyces stellatus]|uniref:Aste57867_10259 protein n=1 Tax=Aphanomyces stellatus TaxID=120398 RepID=A0A485KQP4_9STRA|nr:hypothetical protein As57867_010219 [Aphanomyces stellatus]VFT87134.1 Aste57867_10259 [Aphanomyces stellatus]
MSESFIARYRPLKLRVEDIILVLRWAQVSANRSISKEDLQRRWTQSLLDGGPPSIMERFDMTDFPKHAPRTWVAWHEDHILWLPTTTHQGSTNDDATLATDTDRLVSLEEISEGSDDSTTFHVFEHRAIRLRRHHSTGTATKLGHGMVQFI